MPRRFPGGKLVLASHNQGKLREIRELLAPFNADVISAGELGLPEPEETGLSFVANAELKALAAAMGAQMIALSDDSGLAVDALNGAPGIYSARWAGPQKDFDLAMRKIQTNMGGSPIKTARFICALTLAWPDGHCETVEGKVEGTLTFPPRGPHGFGYDPIFIPDGFDITFGEMDPAKKHEMSHRADAFRKLVAASFS
ncbi:MAG: RdgB/HAM1 family non-canonical purine NTP pyrophosphatase [Proteobacteria bacterium]|nr:RdgB/HAM1 family non-canonical purine NTP pyrophosphatase [Pseudomonadota bacterium]